MASLPDALRIPSGATSFEDRLVHVGNTRIGIARNYTYSPGVTLPKRTWQRGDFPIGASAPILRVDSYGVQGMTTLQVWIDGSGEIIVVQPTDTEKRIDPTITPPDPTEKYPGD